MLRNSQYHKTTTTASKFLQWESSWSRFHDGQANFCPCSFFFKCYPNFILIEYRPVRKKYDSFKLKIFINKKFWKTFCFFTCILPDYVAHDITKEFWKNSHFENMTAGFLLRCQNWLRYEISLIWHWNIDLLKQNWSFVNVKVPNDDQNVI